jgi:hypothetical protein
MGEDNVDPRHEVVICITPAERWGGVAGDYPALKRGITLWIQQR